MYVACYTLWVGHHFLSVVLGTLKGRKEIETCFIFTYTLNKDIGFCFWSFGQYGWYLRLCLSRNQADVDAIMLEIDGTPNKSKLGANAILGVSLSVCRAGAGAKGVPLYKHIQEISGTKELVMPVPAFNVINGGSHAGNNLAMQEFMILPVGATSFAEAFRMGSEG